MDFRVEAVAAAFWPPERPAAPAAACRFWRSEAGDLPKSGDEDFGDHRF